MLNQIIKIQKIINLYQSDNLPNSNQFWVHVCESTTSQLTFFAFRISFLPGNSYSPPQMDFQPLINFISLENRIHTLAIGWIILLS